MRMKSCAYCGRMHPAGYECERKPKYRQKDAGTFQAHTRGSGRWKRKRQEIRERDKNICQCCVRGMPGAIRPVEYENLAVHHIIPLEEDEGKERAFDNLNLITVCSVHHEMAEKGEISRAQLLHIAEEQEAKN